MNKHHQFVFGLIVAISGAATCVPASAQWSTSIFENNPIDTRPENMAAMESVTDGDGGVLVVYAQSPGGGDTTDDILAQRLDRNGNQVWATPTMVLDLFSPFQIVADDLRVISDGAGGAFIAMTVTTGGIDRVLLRQLAGSGSVDWPATGLSPTPAATGFYQRDPELILDNDGGVIVAWIDGRDDIANGEDIWSQKIDAGGDLVWDTEGIPVCQAEANQNQISILSDNDYGCYLAWTDYRSNAFGDVYGQQMLEIGFSAWNIDGKKLLIGSDATARPDLAVAGPAGSFLMACQYTFSSFRQTYVSRHDADGDAIWQTFAGQYPNWHQLNPTIISDGQGGAFVAWVDYRSNGYPGPHTYVQAITMSGLKRWGSEGIPTAFVGNGSNYLGNLVSDGAGGILVAWGDNRLGGNTSVYSQRITNSGVHAWGPSGIPVSEVGSGSSGLTVISDSEGGFVATWSDIRFGTAITGFAQRVGFHGKLGHANPQITSVVDFPQDQGGVVRLDWTRSYLDDFSFADISEYTIWRRYAGAAKISATDKSDVALEVERLVAATSLEPEFLTSQLLAGWSYLDQRDAYHWQEYAYEAATYVDSTGAGNILTDFQVVAHESQFVYWASDPVAGYSVDNLAPGVPLQLAATLASLDGLLTWSASAELAPDLAGYRIYRSNLPNFVPDAGTFLGMTADTTYLDVGLPAGVWHYQVRAEDFHGNESVPSNEAQLQNDVSAVGDEFPRAFQLYGAAPNPFNPVTTLRFSLARAGATTVKVFDTRGRLVKQLLSQDLQAGNHDLMWDGRNEQGRGMPSGVYLVRVSSGIEHGVMKVILAK